MRRVTRGVALLLLASTVIGVEPALAAGGGGGLFGGGGAGDSATGAGGTGSNGQNGDGGGGGGGGAGLTGGSGGVGTGDDTTAGGSGGQAAGAGGAVGQNGQLFNDSGGGGGGGAHGYVGATLPGGASTGGSGGNGGDTGGGISGGGGGGGGGFGAVVTGSGNLGTLGVAVTGGTGGVGGAGLRGGGGGGGGTGLLLSNPGGSTITIQNVVIGGQGGAPGVAPVAGLGAGPGGAGLVGANLTVTTSGTISGGLDGNGVARAEAIVFTGGNNFLSFTNPTSGLIGNISVTGSLTFNQSTTPITLDQAITGSGSVTKAGTATLILSGTSTYTGATTVSAGTLHIAGTGSITSDTGVASGASLINQGIAQNVTNAGASSNSGTIASLDNTGGTFDNEAGGKITGTADISGGAVTNEGTLQGLSTISGGSLGNSGILAGVANQAGGTFDNLTGGMAGAVTNAGTGSNASTITSLDNTGGTFDNKTGGEITGTADISGGAVTNEGTVQGLSTISGGSLGNSGILAGVANQAGGTFDNLTGGTAGAVTNAGTGSNAGTIASLENTGGTFDNKTGGEITGTADISSGAVTNEGTVQGLSTISGGSLGNSGILAGVANQAGGTFDNLTGGTAGAVTNAGTGSNAGTITSLENTGGTFDNKTGGEITGTADISSGAVTNEGTVQGLSTISGGSLGNSGILAGVANQAGGTFDNLTGGTAGAVTNAGTGSNAGTIASLDNTGGTFDNKTGGTVSGLTSITGGTVNNEGTLAGNAEIGSAGTLVLKNGSVTGTVNDSGLFTGAGSTGNTTIKSGGTVTPGANGVGALTVNGTFTQEVGSTYQVVVDPTSNLSNALVVNGTADITGATLNVTKTTPGTPYQLGAAYTVLTATGGVTGSYTVTGDTAISAFADLRADYADHDAVVLKVAQTQSFASVAATANQAATAAGIQSLPAGDPIAIALLNQQSDADARAAFDQLSGEIHSSVKGMLVEDSSFVRDAATSRIRAAFGDGSVAALPVMAYGEGGPEMVAADTDRFAVWGQAFGSWGTTGSDGNAARFDRSTGGLLAGADTQVGDWRVGLVGGYSHSNFDADDRASSGNVDSYHLGLYGGTNWGALALRTGAAYSWNSISTQRSVSFNGFANGLSADYDAGTAQLFGELAWKAEAGQFKFEPFANLAYVSLHTGGFTEQGGAAGLTSEGSTTDATFTTLGLRASTDFALGGIDATARGMLGWRHTFGDTTPLSNLAFAGSDPFTIAGAPIARDAALVEAGLDLKLTASATLGLSYTGKFGNGATDQGVTGTLSVRF